LKTQTEAEEVIMFSDHLNRCRFATLCIELVNPSKNQSKQDS